MNSLRAVEYFIIFYIILIFKTIEVLRSFLVCEIAFETCSSKVIYACVLFNQTLLIFDGVAKKDFVSYIIMSIALTIIETFVLAATRGLLNLAIFSNSRSMIILALLNLIPHLMVTVIISMILKVWSLVFFVY